MGYQWGQEGEKEQRLRDFRGNLWVDSNLMSLAERCMRIFLHWLPALIGGYEV